MKQLTTSDNCQFWIKKNTRRNQNICFQNKDHLLATNQDELITDKLSDKQCNSLDCSFRLNELSNALKNINNNKTPGSDGFQAEFYNMYWQKK